jgi:hypothetical protein
VFEEGEIADGEGGAGLGVGEEIGVGAPPFGAGEGVGRGCDGGLPGESGDGGGVGGIRREEEEGAAADVASHHHRANNEAEKTLSLLLAHLVALFLVCGHLHFYCTAVWRALEKIEEQRTHPPYVRHAENPLHLTCNECLAEAADLFVASVRTFDVILSTHSALLLESEAQLAHRAIVRISEERIALPGFFEDFTSASASTEAEVDDMVLKQLSLLVLVGTMIDAAMPYLRTLDNCASNVAELTSV